MITFIETDYYSSQAAPRLAILPGPNSLEQHTCVKLSGTQTGPSEQDGARVHLPQTPYIEAKPSSSKQKYYNSAMTLDVVFYNVPSAYMVFLECSQGDSILLLII